MILCTQCSQAAHECDTTCGEFHEIVGGEKFVAMKLIERSFTHRKGGMVKVCVERYQRPLVLKYMPMSEATTERLIAAPPGVVM